MAFASCLVSTQRGLVVNVAVCLMMSSPHTACRLHIRQPVSEIQSLCSCAVIILFRSLVLPCVFPLLFHVLVLSNTQLLPFSFIGPFLVIKLFLFSSFPLVHIVANYSRSIFGSILHCRVVAKVVVSAQLCSKSPRLIMSGIADIIIADIIVGILC